MGRKKGVQIVSDPLNVSKTIRISTKIQRRLERLCNKKGESEGSLIRQGLDYLFRKNGV